ncbi:MAG: glycosyltransferase family 39 protein [Elusimicrobia bacterium]|nr:glycosyltransferase family 39 protein [Elusimicrobiota bacterium]
MEKFLTKKNTIIFITLLTICRIYINSTLQLHPDEAYYWLWSHHLQLSYFDHPPMIAYFIKLTTLFFMSEFWVRLSALMVSVLMSFIIWILSKQFFNSEKVSSGSVLLLNVYPLTASGSIIITPDAPAFLFWSLGIFISWQLFKTQKAYLWYVLGIILGLSLLSKYTAILLVPSIFLYMIFTDEKRWLKTVHPYVALVLSIIIFLPVIIWNIANNWVSFKFQMHHGLEGYDLLNGMLEYIGGQLMALTPFAWLMGIWASAIFMFSKRKEKLFLGVTSVPIILLFMFTSLKKAAAPNWPVLAYFTFTIALCAYFLDGKKWKETLWALVFLFSLFFSLLAIFHARFSVIPLEKFSKEWAQTDATSWFYGWKDLAKEIKKYPDVKYILAPSHTLPASIDYYLHENITISADPTIGRFSQYNLWKLQIQPNVKALYVSLEGEALDAYKRYFSEPVTTDYITIYRKNFPIRRFRIIYGNTKSY